MAKDQLIDSRVSAAQCKQAVDALYQWASKQAAKEAENELLPGKEPLVWLNVGLKQMPAGEVRSFKPIRIPIKHPLVDPRTNGICLLTKDPQRQYKDLLEEKNIKFVSRVVGLEKLKGKFNAYEARRALLKENGLFLADDRILPLLPKLLGTKWFEAKKQPIPVCLTRKDLKAELERAISSTYMNQNKGTVVSIKIGTISQKPSQILDNLKEAIPAIASSIKGGGGGWDNIQSLGIKTSNSVHLPIWSCSLDGDEGGRYDGLTAVDDDVEMEGGSDDESEAEVDAEAEVKVPAPAPTVKKGKKKRAAEDEDEDEAEKEKPKKKAKAQASEPKAPATAKAQLDSDKSKAKKRKEAEPPAPAPESKVDDASSKKKRRKSDVPDELATTSATPKKPLSVVSTPDTPSESASKKTKKKGNQTIWIAEDP
ncbi:u3 snornp-associated protein cic1 utp30 family protein [Moniliophthora roreri MCA 2997]|uniref:Ribosomal L1 domain-containing protein 1 n=3 Tax=Moniliophthora roreri TaxID=221103 RepID=V2WQP7_MONRO|nr:u3 snornp-associated protein cic1 utp30 family protein [Moniliophthora roreri MCA 2997]